jgi:hypothetical protein
LQHIRAVNRRKVSIMSKTTRTTELTSQYMTQVADDIERNAKEQERIGAEIAALQEQLIALQHDRTVLVTMQKALGDADSPGAPGAEAPAEPGPEASAVPPSRRRKTAAEPGAGKRTRGRKSTAAPNGKTPKRTAAKKTAAKASAAEKTARPTLVELIRRHLTEQSEPRSAAEISTALSQRHPDRRIQTNVVRTTLEGLVAKGHTHRAKQGSSVFYTSAPAGPDHRTEPAAATSPAGEGAVSG